MHCQGCGKETSVCDGFCRRPLDPPRFCRQCGKKLFVVVTPTAFTAFCRQHGLPNAPHADALS